MAIDVYDWVQALQCKPCGEFLQWHVPSGIYQGHSLSMSLDVDGQPAIGGHLSRTHVCNRCWNRVGKALAELYDAVDGTH